MRHSQLIERSCGGWPVRGLLSVLVATIGVALTVAVLPAAALAASSPSEVQTEPAEVTPTGFKLQGKLNPNGAPTTYYFIYKQASAVECEDLEGCGPETTPGGPLTGDTQQQVSPAEVTGLEPNTAYVYWLIAKNANGTAVGKRLGFTTPPAAPSIDGDSVSNVTEDDATLQATINSDNLPEGAYYQFQLVKSPSEYLSQLTCPEPELLPPSNPDGCTSPDSSPHTPGALPIGYIAKGPDGQSVSLNLATADVTLQPSTTYHYRVLAAKRVQSEDGVDWQGPFAEGPDQTFTTPPAGIAPVIDSVSLSNLTSTDATLEATIDTEGLSTSYEFELWSSPCSHKGAGCELMIDIPLPTGLLLGSFLPQNVSLDLNSAGVTLGGGEYGFSVIATSKAGSTSAGGGVFEPPPPSVVGPLSTTSPLSGAGQPAGSGTSSGDQPAGSGTSSSPSTPGMQSPDVLGTKTTKLEPFENAQKLSKALKLCAKRPKNERPSCKRQAEKKYSAPGKHHR
ncbi:MAG: hypothetical protein ABSB69_00175 [Solirubrobacteraceae bacterium]